MVFQVRSESGMYCSSFRVLKSTSRSLEDNYYEAWLQDWGSILVVGQTKGLVGSL